MKQLIIFAIFLGCAYAGGLYGHGPALVAAPVVQNVLSVHKSVHQAPIGVAHHVQPISIPVHHPSKTTIVEQPTSVLAKAPRLSGYSFNSEVNHNVLAAQKIFAAPVAAIGGAHLGGGYLEGGHLGGGHLAGPIGHGAIGLGAVGHGPIGLGAVGHGPIGYGAVSHGPIGYGAVGHAPIGHGGIGLGAVGHGPVVAPAPFISGSSIHAAPAVVQEPLRISSYATETGRTHIASQAHYAPALQKIVNHVPVIGKVAAPAVVAAPVYGKAIYDGGYGAY